MLAEVAFVVLQARVAVWPAIMVVGDAVRLTIGVLPPPFPLPLPPHAATKRREKTTPLNSKMVLGLGNRFMVSNLPLLRVRNQSSCCLQSGFTVPSRVPAANGNPRQNPERATLRLTFCYGCDGAKQSSPAY
jgi:hypothetical protein